MERNQIIKLTKLNINIENLEKAKSLLEKKYEISYGNYEPEELKKAILDKKPIVIKDHFIIGFNPDGKFVDNFDEIIPIERMVKAVIVEDEKPEEIPEKTGDPYAIIGKRENWDDISLFQVIFGKLRVGEIWLPPHSAVFNFLDPSKKEKKEKIVSELSGVNINIYSPDNYIDNAIHETGHLFWRSCLNHDERKAFKHLFERLKPSAIYNYEWEKTSEEEVFCTIYKWYVKSLLINKSFYNILSYEEPDGLKLLEGVFDRIAKDRITAEIWDMHKDLILDYINPKFDLTTGKHIRKAGILDQIRDIDVPADMLNKVDRVQGGVMYIDLGKAVVPVKGKRIDYEKWDKKTTETKIFKMLHVDEPEDEEKDENGEEKPKTIKMIKAIQFNKPVIYMDMDGVVADFFKGYKDIFFRDANVDDIFTVRSFCNSVPNFFRVLPVLQKGLDIYNALKDRYTIVFLTMPMPGMADCCSDKWEWLKENIGPNDIIFSEDKAKYVVDEKSILIDDMDQNLDPWKNAGGTAIDISLPGDKILEIIEDTLNGKAHAGKVKDQIDNMEVNTEPTEKQKETGNYKKGDIVFKSMNIKIENPKGSIRFGFGKDGKKWIQKMANHYGYITGTEGSDFDPVDCFIGDSLNASRAFVVNQGKDGMFDEHKVMLGFDNIEDAENAYRSNYQKGWDGLISIKHTNTRKLRDWLKDGNKNEPF